MISLIWIFGFLCRYPDDLRNIVQQCARDAVVVAIPKAIFLCSVNGGEHTEWTEEGGAAHVLACLFPS